MTVKRYGTINCYLSFIGRLSGYKQNPRTGAIDQNYIGSTSCNIYFMGGTALSLQLADPTLISECQNSKHHKNSTLHDASSISSTLGASVFPVE